MTTWVWSCGSPSRESQWSYAVAIDTDHVGLSDGAVARADARTGRGDLPLHEVEHLGDRPVVSLDDQGLGSRVGDAPERRHRLRDAERSGRTRRRPATPTSCQHWTPYSVGRFAIVHLG